MTEQLFDKADKLHVTSAHVMASMPISVLRPSKTSQPFTVTFGNIGDVHWAEIIRPQC